MGGAPTRSGNPSYIEPLPANDPGYDPYHDPANFAPAPANPQPPAMLPPPDYYDFGGPGGGPNAAPVPTGQSGADAERQIREQYQQTFGRQPDANELRTDLAGVAKYGLTSGGPTGGVLGQINARGNNAPGSGQLGDPTAPPTSAAISAAQRAGTQLPGTQFSDPYTKLLEQIAQSQMQQYQQPMNTAPWDAFSKFLTSRFDELSQHPGYSPAELSLLRTQASEPIEQYRATSQQRAMERAANAGYLPTSGITQLTQGPSGVPETLDTAYDRMRVAADRDLAINALNRRTQDLQSALQLGGLNVQLPEQQFGAQQNRNQAALQLAALLQQLPAQSLAEAMSVINGTQSPGSLLTQVNQMSQQNRQNQADFWAGIGNWIANSGLTRG